MKRFIYSLLAFAAVAVLSISCTDEEQESNSSSDDSVSFKVTQVLFTVDKEAGEVVIPYTIENPKTSGVISASLSGTATWITNVDTSNDGYIIVSYSANDSFETRKISVVLTYEWGSNSKKATAVIQQSGTTEFTFGDSETAAADYNMYCYVLYYGYQYCYLGYYPMYYVYLFTDSTPQYYFALALYSRYCPSDEFDYENSAIPQGSYICGSDEYLQQDEDGNIYGTIGVDYGRSNFYVYSSPSSSASTTYEAAISDGYVTILYGDDNEMTIEGLLYDENGVAMEINFAGITGASEDATVAWVNQNYYTYNITSDVDVDMTGAEVTAYYYDTWDDGTRDWLIYLENDNFSYKVEVCTEDGDNVSEIPTGTYTGANVAYGGEFYTGYVGWSSYYSAYAYFGSWFWTLSSGSVSGCATLNSNGEVTITKNEDGTYTIDIDAYAYEVDLSEGYEYNYNISTSWTGSVSAANISNGSSSQTKGASNVVNSEVKLSSTPNPVRNDKSLNYGYYLNNVNTVKPQRIVK